MVSGPQALGLTPESRPGRRRAREKGLASATLAKTPCGKGSKMLSKGSNTAAPRAVPHRRAAARRLHIAKHAGRGCGAGRGGGGACAERQPRAQLRARRLGAAAARARAPQREHTAAAGAATNRAGSRAAAPHACCAAGVCGVPARRRRAAAQRQRRGAQHGDCWLRLPRSRAIAARSCLGARRRIRIRSPTTALLRRPMRKARTKTPRCRTSRSWRRPSTPPSSASAALCSPSSTGAHQRRVAALAGGPSDGL